MTEKTVLITGANKGIGFETARQLGHNGYRIWLGSRDEARGKVAVEKLVSEGLSVRLVLIDVADKASVLAAAQQVKEADDELDVLINNAGIAGDINFSPLEQSVASVKHVYETNVFGTIQTIQSFIPLLKKKKNSAIVNLSSGLGSLTWLSDQKNDYYGFNVLGYNTSKSAVNALTLAFSKALANDGIAVNAADPGYTATDFNNYEGPRSVEDAAAGIVWLVGQSASGVTGGYFYGDKRVPW